jgi:thiamine transport system permease protein
LTALFFAFWKNPESSEGFTLPRRTMKKTVFRFHRCFSVVGDVIPLTPLAVSSVILGFGWTLLVPRGNVFALILAQSAMAWPFVWTQIQSSANRVPASVHDASRLLSSGRLDSFFRVLIPLSLRGIFSGAGFAFAISAGDASLPLVLSLSQFENLALMLYRLVGSYRFSEACACAVVLAILSGSVFFLQDEGNAVSGDNNGR